jgi:hypothetical protein
VRKRGRIWAGMYKLEGNALIRKDSLYEAWYDQIARWLRKHFNCVQGIYGYFGPAAFKWHDAGGQIKDW